MSREEWRREKRKLEKIKKAQAHVMTQYEKGYSAGFEAGKRQAMFELAGRCTRLYTTAAAAVAVSEYRFGKIRLPRHLHLIQAQFEDIAENTVQEKKLRDWIKKKTGVNLDDYTGCRRLDVAEELDFEIVGRKV